MKDDTKKISKNREKKEVIVNELTEKLQKAKAIVLTNYSGMTHIQIEGLKKALKPVDAEAVVTKNTLFIKAAEKLGLPVTQQLNGATLTILAYNDVVLPLKELAKSIKALKLPELKFGLLDGKEITAADVTKLATLPSREVLLAQLVGGLKSPIFGLHRALSWNMQRLVLILKAIETKKT